MPESRNWSDMVETQLRLPLVGGRITYEQSLLLPLTTLESGARVLFEWQVRQSPELERLVRGPYRNSFRFLEYQRAWKFWEPHKERVRAYEAPEEEGMCWIEGEKVES